MSQKDSAVHVQDDLSDFIVRWLAVRMSRWIAPPVPHLRPHRPIALPAA